MSFNNPYMKNPDFGQGISDIINQITQMLMLKKFNQKPQETIAQTPTPPAPQMAPMGTRPEKMQALSMAPGMTPQGAGLGGLNETGFNDKDIIAKILALFSRNQGGFGR